MYILKYFVRAISQDLKDVGKITVGTIKYLKNIFLIKLYEQDMMLNN